MNQHYITVDEDGMVDVVGYGYPIEGAIVVDQGHVRNLSSMYVDGRLGLVDRPKIKAPDISEGLITIRGVPAQTLLRVQDMVSGDILVSRITKVNEDVTEIFLEDSGRYGIVIEPPKPWMDFVLEVEQ